MIKLSETQWVNESEEFIGSLKKGSNKMVKGVCPACGKERLTYWYNIVRYGTTFCGPCAALKKAVAMIGKKYGRLTVESVYETRGKGGNTKLNAVCDCGKKVVVLRHHLISGHTKSCGCYHREIHSGENCHLYNPKLTDEDRKRHRSGINTWRKLVLKRDDYTCQVCGSTESLIAHHLDGYKDNSALATDVDNGVTVCKGCHIDFHINFMGGYRVPVTRQDFEDYLEQV